jgi:hypothetical protein
MPYAYIELDELSSEDMIEELEARGYTINKSGSDSVYELYREYVSGNDFDRKLKKFFQEQLDIVIR